MTPALEAAYGEPHRRYHTRAHIEACLALLSSRSDLSEVERRRLEWAIWWHDAIYDPRAADNEVRSAELAGRELPGVGASVEDVEEVMRLIRLTAGHEVVPGDRLGAILVSIDLAVLGAEPAAYDAYAREVREEYSHAPDAVWQAGRAAVLQRFLEAPVILPDPELRAALETSARANLARELTGLR